MVTHGDDVDLELDSIYSAQQLMLKLNSFGFEISPLKTTIATKWRPVSEFLKTLFDAKTLNSYPSRLASGLLLKKPWSQGLSR